MNRLKEIFMSAVVMAISTPMAYAQVENFISVPEPSLLALLITGGVVVAVAGIIKKRRK